MGMGGKAGGQQTQVADYLLSMHYGICRGPVDSIDALYINEKKVTVFTAATSNVAVVTSMPGLFGGDKEQGGIVGTVECYMGGPDQLLTTNAAVRLANSLPGSDTGAFVTNGTPQDMPGFRGIAALFFRGRDAATAVANTFGQALVDTVLSSVKGNKKFGGYKWGSNNPSVPGIWVTVSRKPRGLDSNSKIGVNANPSHMIYECLTNQEWGMGASAAIIDVDSFLVAAQTLRDENFGLSMLWNQQATIQDFIGEIADHISGTLALDPRTGKLFLKLLRKDYDEDSLPVVSPDNATLQSFQRKGWGETVNEVVVTWTNPENEQEETVTAHADANIMIQGAVISDSRNYYGVRDADLAMRLAERDVQNSSTPLIAATVAVDHRFWATKPGDVVAFHWPERGVDHAYMRVMQVQYGQPNDPSIILTMNEDIFGFADAVYIAPPTQWVDESRQAEPISYSRLDTSPYYFVAVGLGDTIAQQIQYPECRALLLTGDPSRDIKTLDVMALQTDIVGNLKFLSVCSIDKQGFGVITSSLPSEYQTDLYPIANYSGRELEVGMTVLIENPDDPTVFELCAVESLSESTCVVRRGVLDTVPLAWAAGAYIWFIDPRTTIIDPTVRSDGESVSYKLLTKTPIDQLPVEEAPVQVADLTDRIYRPYRPANIKLNGTDSVLTVINALDSGITVTWSRRNRLTETAQVLRWTDADVPPEDGQTTTVELLADDGTTVIKSYTGIAGTSQDIPLADFGLVTVDTYFFVRVSSVRDGFPSLTSTSRHVLYQLSASGYGIRYGVDYGT